METDHFLNSKVFEHRHVTIYADQNCDMWVQKFRTLLNDKDYKLIAPTDINTLLQASRNSALVIICLDGLLPESQDYALKLQEDRQVCCDIVGIKDTSEGLNNSLYLKGYDMFFSPEDFHDNDLKKLIMRRIGIGSMRIAQMINEEEHRRFIDALSCAPASVMVFDADKRIVFVSEHYFRAYPKSAPRLCRGLSVYDAFDMMSREEGLSQDNEIFKKVKAFWHNLNGQIEFTLDTGVSYRLTAVQLSNQRGTILTAVNISDLVDHKTQLENALQEIHNLKNKV